VELVLVEVKNVFAKITKIRQMTSAAPHLVLLNEVTALISVGRESDGWTEVRKFVNEQPIQRNSRSLARFNNDPRVSPGLAARDTVWER